MKLDKLYNHQKQINKNFLLDPELTEYKTSARMFLEINVKIASLADETKCFKYWVGNNPKPDILTIFEKYIELMGKIISLGLVKDYIVDAIVVEPSDYCLSDQFLNLFIDINDLIISPSKDHYQTLLEDFISLGISFGYSENQIIEGYLTSNVQRIAL